MAVVNVGASVAVVALSEVASVAASEVVLAVTDENAVVENNLSIVSLSATPSRLLSSLLIWKVLTVSTVDYPK